MGKYEHQEIDDFWEKWDIHVMKLRGEDTKEKEAEIESKRGKRGRSRKSVITENTATESPTKRSRTESVLESLEHQSTTPPPSADRAEKDNEATINENEEQKTAEKEVA